MRKTSSTAAPVAFLVLLFGLTTPEVAAQKSQNVIERSNGFPSGAHHNLNLHGKKDDFQCDPSPGGGSVFILEYGDSTIQYVSNKKSSVEELFALDPCAEAFDGDPARVFLPYEPEGYFVFGRIHGKPQNGSSGDASSIVLVPNPVLHVCNDDPENPDPEFPDATDCSDTLWALGLVTTSGIYEATEAGFERFEDPDAKGKGKSKAKDITGLFLWTGYACEGALDTSGPDGVPDGVLDVWDVPDAYDLLENGGNGDGMIDATELQNWLDDLELSGSCDFHDNVWVFDIADLVVQDQTVGNDGTKLLQIRFYPVATTEFVR